MIGQQHMTNLIRCLTRGLAPLQGLASGETAAATPPTNSKPSSRPEDMLLSKIGPDVGKPLAAAPPAAAAPTTTAAPAVPAAEVGCLRSSEMRQLNQVFEAQAQWLAVVRDVQNISRAAQSVTHV